MACPPLWSRKHNVSLKVSDLFCNSTHVIIRDLILFYIIVIFLQVEEQMAEEVKMSLFLKTLTSWLYLSSASQVFDIP